MKKLLAMVLALVMTLSLAVVGSNAAFKDADKIAANYNEAVQVLSGMGIFKGDNNGNFNPESAITRAEVAQIFYRLLRDEIREAQSVELMKRFLGIETLLGRVRSPDPALRFGPRAIDIDMLLFDDVVSDDPVCVLPHPRLSRRAFWLVPLLDIAPDIRIGGVRAERLLSRLKWRLEDDKIFQ